MSKRKKRPKLGLALGGGGVRACIHIGFYEVLQKEKIKIDFVAGTSMGAVVGAAIALGFTAKEIRDKIVKHKEDLDIFKLKNFSYFNEGILRREVVNRIFDDSFGKKTFKDTKIPFACTSVDLESHKEVVITEGSIAEAVAASSAFPLVFPPVYHKMGYLVDGGIVDNVPSHVVKELGAEKLIAIGIRNYTLRQYIAGQIYLRYIKSPLKKEVGFFERKKNDVIFLLDILMESFAASAEHSTITNLNLAKPDLFLEPIVNIDLLDFDEVDVAIEAGRELAYQNLEKIKQIAAAK